MPMRSCRHVYVAHKIRIFLIENLLFQNPQQSSKKNIQDPHNEKHLV